MTDAFADLAAFDLDPANGFLPGEDPLLRLPDAFAVWDRVGADLPALLVRGGEVPVSGSVLKAA